MNSFKWETEDMGGNIFLLQSENAKERQFGDATEALQRCAAKGYHLDSVFLLPILTDLKNLS